MSEVPKEVVVVVAALIAAAASLLGVLIAGVFSAFARPMDARWTGSPQLPELAQGGIIHASDVDILRYRDIHTNRAEGMDVAVKFGAENHCYGFTNTSYLHHLRNSDWLLPADRYRITVSVYTGSFTATKSFILRNDWPRQDFCLQDEA